MKTAIDQGGRATLMSILHDGLVGNVKMADGMKDQLQAYKDGNLSFSELRDMVVDNYMQVLVKQSQTGASQRKVSPSNSGGNKDVSFKKDQASYNYYKKYSIKNHNSFGSGDFVRING